MGKHAEDLRAERGGGGEGWGDPSPPGPRHLAGLRRLSGLILFLEFPRLFLDRGYK